VVGLAGIVVALVAIPLLGGTAQASCLGPLSEVSPKTVQASGQLTITGRGFAATCNDVIINGQTPLPAKPSTGIRLVFVQNGRSAVLGRVDADQQYRIRRVVIVPTWARPGPASVRADDATVSVTITAARGSGPTDAGTSQLPPTGGGPVLPNALVSIGLLALGALLMRSAHRRVSVGRHGR